MEDVAMTNSILDNNKLGFDAPIETRETIFNSAYTTTYNSNNNSYNSSQANNKRRNLRNKQFNTQNFSEAVDLDAYSKNQIKIPFNYNNVLESHYPNASNNNFNTISKNTTNSESFDSKQNKMQNKNIRQLSQQYQQQQQQLQQNQQNAFTTVSETHLKNSNRMSMSGASQLQLNSLNASSTNIGLFSNSSSNINNTNINQHHKQQSMDNVEKPKPKPVKITSRMIFLKVGSVDTRNERYDAEAYVECWWEDEQIYRLLADPNMSRHINNPHGLEAIIKQASETPFSSNNLVNLKNIINNINLLEYDTSLFWSPQLYIENAIGDLKEEIRHKLEIVEKEGSDMLSDENFDPKMGQYKTLVNNLTVRVCEMRKIRGVFYERLELYDFPMDMQELSITLTSKRNTNEVVIVENKKDLCSINTQNFLDQQEWDLFNFVKTKTKVIYDPWRKYERTGFTISCFIARRPGYYLYNAYMLVLLITMLGFVPFAFDSGSPQFRCQICGLLILTSVNFRWIVTQKLPLVPYLTSLDKYAIVYNLSYLTWFVRMYRSIRSFETQNKNSKTITDISELMSENNNNNTTTTTNANLSSNVSKNPSKSDITNTQTDQILNPSSISLNSNPSASQINTSRSSNLNNMPNNTIPNMNISQMDNKNKKQGQSNLSVVKRGNQNMMMQGKSTNDPSMLVLNA